MECCSFIFVTYTQGFLFFISEVNKSGEEEEKEEEESSEKTGLR